jgi:hypothetical protein
VSMHPEKCLAGMLRVLQKLDERDAWGGDLLLRRRAYAYRYHACSWIYLANCSYRSAVVSLLRSLAYYPLPFRLDDVATRFERPKRLIRAVAALVRSTFGVLPRDQMSARGTGEFGDNTRRLAMRASLTAKKT